MSTTDQTQDEQNQSSEVDELSILKQRAQLMGIKFSNNIGIDTLREKVQAKLGEEETEQEQIEVLGTKAKTKTLRQKVLEENMKLIRLRITCLDPKKKDLPGEIMTVANEYLGTVRKFIPFGSATDEGYHVPYCIYKMLKARKFLSIRVIKNPNKQGESITQTTWVQEFALEVLPTLTQDELDKLAASQSASGGVG